MFERIDELPARFVVPKEECFVTAQVRPTRFESAAGLLVLKLSPNGREESE
jgi:hypothetical protein